MRRRCKRPRRPPTPWTVEALTTYLRTGLSAEHGAAAGPMAAVTQELAAVPELDVRAIAVYFASMMSHPPPGAPARDTIVTKQSDSFGWRMRGMPWAGRANDAWRGAVAGVELGCQCTLVA